MSSLEEYCANLLAVILRNCEVTEAVSTVRSEIVKRFIFPATAFVVPLFAVALEVGDPFCAFLFVEHTGREDFTHRLNTGINPVLGTTLNVIEYI